MPDIQAQTPDGVIHSFPDGTPDAVIDKAIKSHVTTKAQGDYTEAVAALNATVTKFAAPQSMDPSPLHEAIVQQQNKLNNPAPGSTLANVNQTLAPIGQFMNSQRGKEMQMATGMSSEIWIRMPLKPSPQRCKLFAATR